MALAATALLLGAVAVFWPRPALVIRDDSGSALRVIPLRGPLTLRLEYLHSVERTPVLEHYVAAAGGLRLVRMEFASQGAGLPTSGYVREGGRFVLHTDRWLPALSIRVSGTSRPRLVINDDVLDLLALVGDGGGLHLQVRRRFGIVLRR
ncbi:MAG: DUF1850 domain-containing protein [Armatimonadota bacterium]|nr:DUF1850 domain-containing protein [Armatimonadota bacterium]MDR7452377.1 DUF1850 domain-containing protein [Armatimonadota bacterium]MDR7466722.1 DUF1850 domain-containing protein [Armatimonadota bacterium]MDR7492804.1 DUF1850 domain-containing protein [Armatimonadota bacterium]MDR7498580.1 DUF1850 domain-containing protein [Armatimonadota bacterium]